jgi:UDPglucose--hexose-1-phosphate uridylyltransferase
MELLSHPHRRCNILTGDWVLVSPQRTMRPWKGKTEPKPEKKPAYDPGCYLCPGNLRANGETNPEYESTYVFTNDYPAMYPETPLESIHSGDLIMASSEKGLCRVICYTPRHDLDLGRLAVEEIAGVIEVFREECVTIGDRPDTGYVQIFENRGERMGASNPHPHCQLWANESVPAIPALETEKQKEHMAGAGSCLLCDYLDLEMKLGERIVFENEDFAVLVPFWAVWPYETMILPRAHSPSLLGLEAGRVSGLADAMKRLTIAYDGLFDAEFPYSMGIHQAPTDGEEHAEWHYHLHYFPPLLRSASVSKFMVGYELLAMPQRDITPEAACAALRREADRLPAESGGARV